MPKQPQNNAQNNPSKTNAEEVRKQNAQSAMQQPMNEEYGSETNVNEVKKQIQQAEANKQQASSRKKNNNA